MKNLFAGDFFVEIKTKESMRKLRKIKTENSTLHILYLPASYMHRIST